MMKWDLLQKCKCLKINHHISLIKRIKEKTQMVISIDVKIASGKFDPY